MISGSLYQLGSNEGSYVNLVQLRTRVNRSLGTIGPSKSATMTSVGAISHDKEASRTEMTVVSSVQ